MPITTPVPDVLYLFEITLCSTLFGWFIAARNTCPLHIEELN